MKKKLSKMTSVDGKRQISVEEFDRIADSGSDEIDEFIDWTKGKRGGVVIPVDGHGDCIGDE